MVRARESRGHWSKYILKWITNLSLILGGFMVQFLLGLVVIYLVNDYFETKRIVRAKEIRERNK